MSVSGNYGNIDYLLWRKAYLPEADVLSKGNEGRYREKGKPDGVVERDEWERYFARTVRSPATTYEFQRLDILNGEALSGALRSDNALYDDYKNLAAYIRASVENDPRIMPGVKASDIGDDPAGLLALAKEHPHSAALNYWLAESGRFQNVPPEYRSALVDHFLAEMAFYKKETRIGHTTMDFIIEFLQSDAVISEHGARLVRDLPKLIDFSSKAPANSVFVNAQLYLISRLDVPPKERMALFDKLVGMLPLRGAGATASEKETARIARTEFLQGLAMLVRSDKLTEEEIVHFCKKGYGVALGTETEYRTYSETFSMTLAYAYLNPKVGEGGAKEILKLHNDFLVYLANKNEPSVGFLGKEAAFAAVVMSTASFRPLSSPNNRRDFLLSVVEGLFSNPKGFYHSVPSDLFLALVRVIPRDEFTAIFAESVNRALSSSEPKNEEVAQTFGVLINYIHDWDTSGTDSYRTEIIDKLSPDSRVLLLSLAGSDLYTTTFLKIYSSLGINEGNIGSFIKTLDSIEAKFAGKSIVANFILTLASFAKFTEVFSLAPQYFFDHIERLLRVTDEDQLATNAFMLTDVIKKFMSDPLYASQKGAIEAALLDIYKKDPYTPVSYIIKINQGNFSEARRAEVDAICAKLPSVLAPMIPASWVNNNDIKAKLFFYQEEHWALIQTMFKARGFTSKKIDDKTVELERTMNGLKVVLSVTMNVDGDNIGKVFLDDEYQVVSHRGHSYQLTDTFRDSFRDIFKGKLLYVGSCGGFRSVPDLMKNYNGNYFISTEVTGRGETNNNVLYYLLEFISRNKDGIAQKQVSFEASQQYVAGKMPRFEEAAIIFPHRESLLIYDFLAQLPPRPAPAAVVQPEVEGSATGVLSYLASVAERIIGIFR